MTNADRIRSMTDEEIAEFMLGTAVGLDTTCLWCDGKNNCIDETGDITCDDEKAKGCIIRWLKRKEN